MTKKKRIYGFIFAVIFFFGIGFVGSTTIAMASELDDSIASGVEQSTVDRDNGIANMFKNYRPFTEGQLQEASAKMSPIASAAGVLISILLWVALIGIFVMTALDMVYMALPPIRGLLYKNTNQGQGGMMGGYGRMGMGGMGGSQPIKKGHQWVSDEAVQASIMLDQARGMSTGGSGGGMGYGGMGYGAMGAHNQQMDASDLTSKGVLVTYLKSRAVFLIMFGICAIVLTCSALLGLGVNAGMLIVRLIDAIASGIPNIF